MNYKIYRKLINELIMENQRNKTIKNKMMVLKELDKGNKELKRMNFFLTNELITKMLYVMQMNTQEDYEFFIKNHQKLNMPVNIINDIYLEKRNIVKELCISDNDKEILQSNKVPEKLKIIATIIINFNHLIEILSTNNNTRINIKRLLNIKDLSYIPYDESFISYYGKNNLKKILNNNKKLSNKEIAYLFDNYPKIFDYIDDNFELKTNKMEDDSNIDYEDLNRVIGSLAYKLKL